MKMPDRFMVVDDDPINNMLCNLAIQRFCKDANVKLFTEPESALAAIDYEYKTTEEMLSTILMLDINMPGMTGWEFLAVFQDFNEYIHNQFTTFILSSSVDDSDIEKAKTNPLVSGFVSKPFTSESIKHMVTTAQKTLL